MSVNDHLTKQIGAALNVDILKFDAKSMEAIVRVRERSVTAEEYSAWKNNALWTSLKQLHVVPFFPDCWVAHAVTGYTMHFYTKLEHREGGRDG